MTAAAATLLEARDASGHWVGTLSSSALSTATAACALELYRRARPEQAVRCRPLVESAVSWIARNQNEDGGWGDSVDSPSNISTTVLAWVALGVDPELEPRFAQTVQRAENWIRKHAGGLSATRLSERLVEVYGDDHTFSIPILTMCALGGRFGAGRDAWRSIPAIPFELGAVPHRWLRRLGLPMVSYALPALIAIGQVKHHCRPARNPITRLLRVLTRRRTLRVLSKIQPSGGGFLEAAPLTSFVTMSLVGSGNAAHPVAKRAVEFLATTVRSDGSWPIDTNLATWLTTLSVNAMTAGGRLTELLSDDERAKILAWLLDQQYLVEHPYTAAAPGGWAWTDLSGGVPDADDTAGALLAIHNLSAAAPAGCDDADLIRRAWMGVHWLLRLQNRDGGIPTFCRGWGRMPFDRSSPDLTAHALRAWQRWRSALDGTQQRQVDRASARAVQYLLAVQEPSGAWNPLWFGNQSEPNLSNPLYGTTRVLLAGELRMAATADQGAWEQARRRGTAWLLAAQAKDGGWGGAASIAPSIEETALALEALSQLSSDPGTVEAIARGVAWLKRNTDDGRRFEPTPIGLYFAKLWYSESLYPTVFTVAALERLRANEALARSVPAEALDV